MATKKRPTLGIASSSDDDWQAESDLRTLIDAEKIEADPKRYARAKALAKRRMMEVAKVASEGGSDES
jgi:hypothetical protein